MKVKGAKKRVLSAAGRAAISKAAKKRWAKVKKQAKESCQLIRSGPMATPSQVTFAVASLALLIRPQGDSQLESKIES